VLKLLNKVFFQVSEILIKTEFNNVLKYVGVLDLLIGSLKMMAAKWGNNSDVSRIEET